MLLYALTIFLSAFLLFQVQPVTAKMILPWFGGSSSVWSTCMVFFQTALLAGYLYAHWIHEKFSPRRQAVVHTALLAVSLFLLPLGADPAWKGEALAHPSLRILGLLSAMVGLPYFLLATTGPLLQAWFARMYPGRTPYRLYAISNVASMLALLSYPVLVEPNFRVRVQAVAWSWAFGGFALLCTVLAWRAASSPGASRVPSTESSDQSPRPGFAACALWIALAACASTLLLATTTHLTQDVAAVPFLWILPLSVYLLTFILCFESPDLYVRKVFLCLLPFALAGAAYLLSARGAGIKIPAQILCFNLFLFVFCMVCHGELVSRRPNARHLTLFYLMLSLGGALGGSFVGLMAPALFNAYYEFPLGLALCAALTAVVLWAGQGGRARLVLSCTLAAYMVWLGFIMRESVVGYITVVRNFYSQLRVYDADDEEVGLRRKLVHGRINHGEQILAPVYRSRPVSYFCPGTGVGQALTVHKGGQKRNIGILGLGCGPLLAYGKPGDIIRVYEINPQVLEIARSQFSFLTDSPAHVEAVLGDGRLTLEREPSRKFDVLVMDAFSGDSVPTHLITLEAFETYFRHLKPDGILAVNVTNTYLDLRPVIAAAAHHFHKVALDFIFKPDDSDDLCFTASWVLMMSEEQYRAMKADLSNWTVLTPRPGFRPWTDDYSNLVRILY